MRRLLRIFETMALLACVRSASAQEPLPSLEPVPLPSNQAHVVIAQSATSLSGPSLAPLPSPLPRKDRSKPRIAVFAMDQGGSDPVPAAARVSSPWAVETATGNVIASSQPMDQPPPPVEHAAAAWEVIATASSSPSQAGHGVGHHRRIFSPAAAAAVVALPRRLKPKNTEPWAGEQSLGADKATGWPAAFVEHDKQPATSAAKAVQAPRAHYVGRPAPESRSRLRRAGQRCARRRPAR